ncbi:hypothetical protein ACE38W_02485 [Chitinophaga sp. Hz27]|uniref:hypothetical protein n=1 Tax=Chitinophaga sp. Hz27 TaxID=3347169 RepID=UPI0035D64136
MYHCVLSWSDSSSSNQDWQIYNYQEFELLPAQYLNANVIMHDDYTFQIAVSTNGAFAAANLNYKAADHSFTLTSATPHEFDLERLDNVYIIRCYLEDINAGAESIGDSDSNSDSGNTAGSSAAPVPAKRPSYGPDSLGLDIEFGKLGFPAYQLYMDDKNDLYCSPRKVNNNIEGRAWIRNCVKAHVGTFLNGKPWTSQEQEGTSWPENGEN